MECSNVCQGGGAYLQITLGGLTLTLSVAIDSRKRRNELVTSVSECATYANS